MEPVETTIGLSGDKDMSRLATDIVDEVTCHGDLCLGLLGERHTHGVTDAVGKQCTDTHGTFDSSVLTLTGFRHTEMERIVHILFVHRLNEQTHGAHHDDGVARLDGDDDIVEVVLLTDTQKLHAALHDTFRCVAVAVTDTVGERAMVHTDTDCRVVLLTDVEKRHESVLDLLQFLGILLIGIFMFDKLTRGVYIVAGVDTHLLGI